MKVLVLGATGMLGHKLLQRLGHRFEVVGTVRGSAAAYADTPSLAGLRLIGGVNVERLDEVAAVLDAERPSVLINCVGIIKQLPEAKDPLSAIAINAMLPHQLARLGEPHGIRLIHFSTDCVFSGRQGPYREEDVPDATDLYGRTKLLGEVSGPRCLTLRTSIVGRELSRGASLIDWFLAQKGKRARGFTRALYSGLTTNAMADLVGRLIADFPDLDGVWHVSGDAIDKYELLSIVNRVYGLGIELDRDEDFHCDRRLDSSRFRAATGFKPESWETMIAAMHGDPLI